MLSITFPLFSEKEITVEYLFENLTSFYQKNQDTLYNLFCIIVFPIGITRATAWATKKFIHIQAARFFIPAFRANTSQRAASEVKIASIIEEKKDKYTFERHRVPCGKVELDGMKIVPKNYRHTKRLINFSHGNKGTIALLLDHPMLYAIMDRLQAAVFVTDYQGVGQSTFKTPTLDALLKNTKATLDYAIKHFKPQEFIIWGFSFGGAIVTALNYKPPVTEYTPHIKSMTVADRTFSSLEEEVKATTKSPLTSSFSQFINWKLNPAVVARASYNDLLVLFHALDKTVPIEASLGEALKHDTPANVTLQELQGDLNQITNTGLQPTKEQHKRPFRPKELRDLAGKIEHTLRQQKK